MIERTRVATPGRVPRHLAVEIAAGGAAVRDADRLLDLALAAIARGIEIVSLRVPEAEAEPLVRDAAAVAGRFAAARVCIRGVGSADHRSPAAAAALAALESETAAGRLLALNLTLGYDPRREIVEAVRALARDVRSGVRPHTNLGDDALAPYLATAGLPDPELLVRIGAGPAVPSSFLVQIAYTELWCTPADWADFDGDELDRALTDFGGRQRRFGT